VSDSTITAESAGEKIWLLKGDPSWTDYAFEFDFKRSSGTLVICLRAAPDEPESGVTVPLSERPFVSGKWYHVKCRVGADKAVVTTSFNDQEMSFAAKRASGIVGFLLLPDSGVQVRNVTMELP
jgi:hypothetical protein